jgi:eukaryotic-like serine/threonine-protein kinase
MSAKLERGSLLHKRYRIVEVLGQGGMGSVYHAVDENLGMDVAVKENLFTSDEYTRQFRLEAVILANLRQANLPRVTDHFVISGQGQYLIMDFIEGEDLHLRMERSGPIPVDEAIKVGAAICDALQYLHTRKPSIIHRDLKPGNVRITPEGHIYLVDFGLVKLVKGGQATTSGARAMTPGYSPPEQYGAGRTDPRTDVYSLGATLYAALTGIIPEDGLARAVDDVELTPLRKRNPSVSRRVAAAIEKAMAVNPQDRFQSAEEFKQALLASNIKTQTLGKLIPVKSSSRAKESRKAQNGSMSPAGSGQDPQPASAIPSGDQPHRARPLRIYPAILFVAIMALILIIIFWSPITKAFTLPQVTPTRLASATASTGIATSQIEVAVLPSTPQAATPVIWTPVPTNTLIPTPTSLGGGSSQIAFASDRTGAPQIYLMDPDGGNQYQLTNLPDGACQPAWSPDGQRLVFISPCLERLDEYPGASLYLINADRSGLLGLTTVGAGDYDPAWSPDGTRIAFTSLRAGNPQIFVLDLGDSDLTQITAPSSDSHLPDWSAQPVWLPGGSQIIFTGHGLLTDAMQIWVMSDAGRGPSYLVHRDPTFWDFLPALSPDGRTIVFSETSGAQKLGWLMLYIMDDPSANPTRLRMQALGTNAHFSPDGIWIVYETLDNQDGNRSDYDIYRIRSDGTGTIFRLTDSVSMEFDPAWRPAHTP